MISIGEKMVEIKWTPIIIGSISVIILSYILGAILGSWGGTISYLLVTIYVGYNVLGDYRNVAIHGALVGIISGLFFGILTLISLGVSSIGEILAGVIVAGIFGAFGGSIGLIIAEETNYNFTFEEILCSINSEIEVKWTQVIIGFVLAITLAIVFGAFIKSGGYIGYLLATIYVGYIVSGDYMNGAIHGALVGVIGGILGLILTVIATNFGIELGLTVLGTGIISLIFVVIIDIIVGTAGGVIGILIKGEAS